MEKQISVEKQVMRKNMPTTLTSIRRRVAENSLEVEHIFEAAAQRLDGLPDLLAELSDSNNWSDTNHLPDGSHVVPLARWARVASAYFRDGLPGLRRILVEPGHESFVLTLLEELHSTEAVGAVMDFFSEQIASPASDPPLARKIASSLNLLLCFKPEVEIDAAARQQIRVFATTLVDLGYDQVERAVPVLLLRAVGDESSIRLLDNLTPFYRALGNHDSNNTAGDSKAPQNNEGITRQWRTTPLRAPRFTPCLTLTFASMKYMEIQT